MAGGGVFGLVLQSRGHKTLEEGMGAVGTALELGVELHAHMEGDGR